MISEKEFDFDELLMSAKEAVDVVKGKKKAARVTKVELPDVVSIRHKMQLSRSQFAMILGVSSRTVESWEQGLRVPSGAARSLLMVAEKHPDVVLKAVQR